MRMNPPLRIAIVMGSDRENRFCDTVTRWVLEQLHAHADLELDVIDPALFEFPRRSGSSASHAVRALSPRIGRADGFVVVTPEYNHSFPAALKQIVDAVKGEWRRKPVAFVSYGGLSGGLRAIEHLRLVFAELDSVSVRDTVSFSNASRQFGPDGRLQSPADATAAMAKLLTGLRWWTRTLRRAREEDAREPVASSSAPGMGQGLPPAERVIA